MKNIEIKVDGDLSNAEKIFLKDLSLDKIDKTDLKEVKLNLEAEKQQIEKKIAKLKSLPDGIILKKWAHWNEVKILQEIIWVSADGVFGPQTELALKRYQQKLWVPADGIFGNLTKKAALSYYTKADQLIDNVLWRIDGKIWNSSHERKHKGLKPVHHIENVKSVIDLTPDMEKLEKQDPDINILADLGVKPDLIDYITLSKEGKENIKKIKTVYERWKVEEAKRLTKELLADPKNFQDLNYLEFRKRYEEAVKNLDKTPIKVDTSGIEWIDNLEEFIISKLNDKIKKAKIKVEEAGETKTVSLSDYLASVADGILLTFEDGKIKAKQAIDEKAISKLWDIVKDTLPANISEKDIKLTLKLDNWLFSNSVEVTDIDSKSWTENIEKLVRDTIDFTKEKVLLKPTWERKENVVYISEIDPHKVYKVVLEKWKEEFVLGKDLKKYLEKAYKEELKNIKEELDEKNVEEKEKADKRISKLVYAIEDIEVDKTEANLEELGLEGLKLDWETPEVTKKWNEYIIDIDGIDDLVIKKDGENLFIRDQENKLPTLKVRTVEDVQEYYSLLKKYKFVENKLRENNEILSKNEEAEVNWDIVHQLSKKEKERLIAENKIYEEFKKDVANINSIAEIQKVESKLENSLSNLKNKELNEKKLAEELENVEGILKSLSFDKKDLETFYDKNLLSKEAKYAVKSWLENFDKKVSIHSISSKIKWDKVEIKFDFDDKWLDEEFDKDITIVMDKSKVYTLDKNYLENIIKNKVIPQIAMLSQKWKDVWNDKKNKTIEL